MVTSTASNSFQALRDPASPFALINIAYIVGGCVGGLVVLALAVWGARYRNRNKGRVKDVGVVTARALITRNLILAQQYPPASAAAVRRYMHRDGDVESAYSANPEFFDDSRWTRGGRGGKAPTDEQPTTSPRPELQFAMSSPRMAAPARFQLSSRQKRHTFAGSSGRLPSAKHSSRDSGHSDAGDVPGAGPLILRSATSAGRRSLAQPGVVQVTNPLLQRSSSGPRLAPRTPPVTPTSASKRASPGTQSPSLQRSGSRRSLRRGSGLEPELPEFEQLTPRGRTDAKPVLARHAGTQ